MKGKLKTKSNKNIFVTLLLILAFLITPFTAIVKCVGKVFAGTGSNLTNVNGKTIKLKKFVNKVALGGFYTLPSFTLDGVDKPYSEENKSFYKVVSPIGKDVPIVEKDGKYGFYANLSGVYTLSIISHEDGVVDSTIKNLKIKVVDSEIKIAYPENSEFVIPNKVPQGSTLKIPAVEVIKPNEIDLTGYSLNVKVKSAKSSTEKSLTLSEDGKYYALELTDSAETGNYEVVFEYSKDSVIVAKESKQFECVSKDKFNKDIKLSFELNSSMPTTAVAGVETTLPTIKVTDSNSHSDDILNAYTKIVIKYYDVENDKYIDVTNQVLKGYKFKANALGNFYVTYQVIIPYSTINSSLKDVVSEVASYTIKDVKDNVDPEIKYVKAYTVENGKITKVGSTDIADSIKEEQLNELLGNEVNTIPSIVVLNKTKTDLTSDQQGLLNDTINGKNIALISLPALFATDNLTEFKDLKLTREVRVPSGSYEALSFAPSRYKSEAGNAKGEYKYFETADYVITSEGTYYFRFTAEDKAGNTIQKTFPVKAISTSTFTSDYSTIKPKITMSELPSSVKSDGSIEFTFTAKDEYDERLNNEVKVVATVNGANKDVDAKFVSTKDNKYIIDVNGFANTLSLGDTFSELKITATSKNDYNTDFSTEERVVKVIDVNDENPATIELTAPGSSFILQLEAKNGITPSTIQSNGLDASNKEVFNQKQTIKLPDFVISDNESGSLTFDLTITDKAGNNVPVVYNYVKDRTIGSGFKYNLTDASFVANYSGVYTLTYTVTDAGNNITTISYAVVVKDTEAPTIVFVDETNLNTTIQLGNTITLPKAGLLDDGEVVKLDGVAYTDVEVSSNGIKYFDFDTYKFTPEETGTFTFTYYGYDTAGNKSEPRKYTITVQDTIDPVLNQSQLNLVSKTVGWDKELESVKVEVPYVSFTDAKYPVDKNGNLITLAEVSVTNAKGEKQELIEVDGRRYFEATKQGIYTIKYTATDYEGNTSTVSKEVAVGNCYQPTIKFVGDYKIPEKLNVGESFTLSLDPEFVIIEDQDGDDEEITKTITLKGPNGKTIDSISSDSYSWKFEETGEYQLIITLNDGVTGAKTSTFKINVAEKEVKEKTKISTAVGTILIIVSILALGAVVIYFVLTNKKSKSKKSVKKVDKTQL